MEDMDPSVPDPQPKPGRKRLIAAILIVVVVLASLGVIYDLHENALAPSNVIIGQKSVDSILPGFSQWETGTLPTGSNVASRYYTNGTPNINPFGPSTVTNSTLLVILIKNGSTSSAVSAFNYLKDHVSSVLNEQIGQGNVTSLSIPNFSGRYFAFYNVNTRSSAIVFQYYSYVCVMGGMIMPSSMAIKAAQAQIALIGSVMNSYAL